jgi:hypothetical protein
MIFPRVDYVARKKSLGNKLIVVVIGYAMMKIITPFFHTPATVALETTADSRFADTTRQKSIRVTGKPARSVLIASNMS